jgi:hypothetical protein
MAEGEFAAAAHAAGHSRTAGVRRERFRRMGEEGWSMTFEQAVAYALGEAAEGAG